MNSNNHQVGGNHYQSEYQHWDFVCDLNIHYLLGCATKYIARWKKKNGVEDLKKAVHYFEKAKDRDLYFELKHDDWLTVAEDFCRINQIGEIEEVIVKEALKADYEYCIQLTKALIKGVEYATAPTLRS